MSTYAFSMDNLNSAAARALFKWDEATDLKRLRKVKTSRNYHLLAFLYREGDTGDHFNAFKPTSSESQIRRKWKDTYDAASPNR